MRSIVTGFAPRLMAGVVVAMMGCAAGPAAPELREDLRVASEEERDEVHDAMRTELERSMERIALEDYQAPYFLSYHLRDEESYQVSGRFGALTSEDHSRRRFAYVESRVGDYDFDNFASIDAESFRMSDYRVNRLAPIDGDRTALRGALWLLTDESYKRALSDYQTKRGGAVYSAEEDDVASFTQEESQQHRGQVRPLAIDESQWRSLARDITARIRDHDFVLDANMEIEARRVVRYLINSEGTDIIDEHTIYAMHVTALTRADDGMLLDNGWRAYARDADQLPDRATIEGEVDSMLADLEALREAPVLDPYTGPAILAPEAAGVLFHEAVGHRLEGERQRDPNEGRTFTGQVGNRLMPEFLSVYDDPSLEAVDDTQLNGYYRYDDQGVAAQRASLIEDGHLAGFLLSRTPVEGFNQSNGHARAQGVNVPRARMANLVVEADPEHLVSEDELRQMLIDEVRAQGKPYGLLIRDVTGGSTNTSGFGYQAFKGVPRMVYKVDAETGEETLVRGAELVGTPLSAIGRIQAAAGEPEVFNGYCGAESGYVPVSTVAPMLLTSQIEVQRSQGGRERNPVLPAPWADEGATDAPEQAAEETADPTEETPEQD